LLIQALGGQVVNVFTHRDRFHALEGELVNRDLIASYVPISTKPGQPAEAVFEVYADVTEERQEEAEAWHLVVATLLSTLGALYLFLLVTVRRADKVMGEQERVRAEQAAQVHQLAFHDGLTGLPNRRSFGIRLSESLALARRQRQNAALMFIDLDGFKGVNDALGHAAGDALLKELAGRLQAVLREGEQLFRVGGDEFTVVLPRVSGPDELAALAQRLVAEASRPVSLSDGEVKVGASIGIAVFPDDASEADVLLRAADDAMYAAKARGKGLHAFHVAPDVSPGVVAGVVPGLVPGTTPAATPSTTPREAMAAG
jgi:diguanylate cyclase (GGDEF)-like protein